MYSWKKFVLHITGKSSNYQVKYYELYLPANFVENNLFARINSLNNVQYQNSSECLK